MTNFIYAGIIGAITAFAVPTASAHAGEHHKRGGGMCKMLECTETQQAAVTKIKQEQRAEMEETRKDMAELRGKLAAEFAKPKLDSAKVDQIQGQINALHADMANARLDAMKEIHTVLTPAQRTKLAEKMKTHGPGHRGKWGPGHRGKHKQGAPKSAPSN